MLYLDGIIYILFIDMNDVMDLQITTATCLFYKLNVFCQGNIKIVYVYHMCVLYLYLPLLFFKNKQITKIHTKKN
jgi:hypothetical protein